MDWWLWVAGGLLLLLIELVTPSGFFVMFFGLGAITVGLLAATGITAAASIEWFVFIAASTIYLLLFRGRMRQRAERAPDTIDTLVGEIAVPRERILPGQVGRVELRGSLWSARNDTAAQIEAGQRCRVTRVDGLLVGVQPE